MPSRPPPKGPIPTIRKKIDRIDQKIMSLLVQRAGLALQIGQYKKEHQLPVYEPAREQEVCARAAQLSRHPLSKTNAKNIFHAIIRVMRSIQLSRGTRHVS